MTKLNQSLEAEASHSSESIRRLASEEDVASRTKPDTVTETAAKTGGSFVESPKDTCEGAGNKAQGKKAPAVTETTTTLHPFVHWAQSQTHVSLRVDLIQAENLSVRIGEDGYSLKFFARGTGAHGLQDYNFSVDFLSQVDEKVVTHAIERYVLILIPKKEQPSNWPRLTKQQTKFPWLRVDFDRYAGDGDDSNSDSDNCNDADFDLERRSQRSLFESKILQQQQQTTSNSWSSSLDNIFKNNQNNFDIFDPFNRRKGASRSNQANMKYDYRKETVAVDNSKNTAKHALDFKKTYLFIYNLVMFIMFLKVNLVLTIKGLSGTFDDDIVKGAAFIIRMLTYTQLLESIHPILGLVPGGPMMPLLQVFGRIVVNYFLTEPSIRTDAGVWAPYLFIVWSSIEIFRYSFYALRIFKVNIYPLTWCRYTLFMPLYPCGGLCESMVVLSTIKYYEKSGGLSYALPNAANISFSLPFFLRFYIIFLLGPSILYLMKYMWNQRCKQLQVKDKNA